MDWFVPFLFIFVHITMTKSDLANCDFFGKNVACKGQATGELIYDCLKNKKDDIIVELWNNILPENTTTVGITNCKTVTFVGQEKNNVNFRDLKVENVEHLTVAETLSACLPEKIVLKNVKFTEKFPIKNSCPSSKGTVKSLVLKNVNINVLPFYIISNLEKLEMDNTSIGLSQTDSFKIWNEDATITIINSTIHNSKRHFIDFNVSKVRLSNNVFNFTQNGTITLIANDVSIDGNTFSDLTDERIKIYGDKIRISNNSIRTLDMNMFEYILPKVANGSSLNFSNNEILNLSLMSEEIGDHAEFEAFNFRRNKLNCSCDNIRIFNWLQKNHSFFEFGDDNNDCLIAKNFSCLVKELLAADYRTILCNYTITNYNCSFPEIEPVTSQAVVQLTDDKNAGAGNGVVWGSIVGTLGLFFLIGLFVYLKYWCGRVGEYALSTVQIETGVENEAEKGVMPLSATKPIPEE